MNWESVKFVDPYLGLLQFGSPYGALDKQLLQEECETWTLPPDLKVTSHLHDPKFPVILVCGGLSAMSAGEKTATRESRKKSSKDDSKLGREILIFNPEKNSWKYFGVMPEPRVYHAAVFTRGCVYITGGNDPTLNPCEQTSNATLRLNTNSKRWKRMADMKFYRCFHSMVSIDDHIFVFGGRDKKGSVLFSAERYNPESDEWSVVRRMPEPRMGMGCAIKDGQVWLLGGMTYPAPKGGMGLPILDSVACFDPVKNMWYRKTRLNQARAFFGAATIFREVWAFGGLVAASPDSDELVSVPWVDVFKLETLQWERRHELSTPKHAFALAKSDHRVFLFGGMTAGSGFRGKQTRREERGDRRDIQKEKLVLNDAEMFDKTRNQITELASLPIPLVGSVAVGLPVDLEDKQVGRTQASDLVHRSFGSKTSYSAVAPSPEWIIVNEDKTPSKAISPSLDQEDQAVTVIQSWYRGHVTRNEYAIDALVDNKKVMKATAKAERSGVGEVPGEQVQMEIARRRAWGRSHVRASKPMIYRKKWRTKEQVVIPSWPAPKILTSSSYSLRSPSTESTENQQQKWRRHHVAFLPDNDPNLGIVGNLDNFFQRHKHIMGLRNVDTPPFFVQEMKHIKELQDETLPMIVTFGGLNPKDTQNLNVGRLVMRYHPFKDRWEYFGLMPEARFHHGVAYLEGIIYVSGGYNPKIRDSGEMIATKTLFGLDLRNGKWRKYANMHCARAHHGFITMEGRLMAIGGRDHRGRIIASTEIYEPLRDSWTQSDAMDEGRMGMGMTVCEEVVWMLGGAVTRSDRDPHEHFVISNVDCYDIKSGKWFSRPPLRVPRAYASAVTVKYKDVWIIGGCSKAYHEKNYLESMCSLDRYDEGMNEWFPKGEMVNARHCAAVIAVDDCIYMIGGMSSQEWTPLSRTELYIVDDDEFYLPAEMPVAVTGLGAVKVPPLVPTFRSESVSDMVRQRIGYPVHSLRNKRIVYRVIPPLQKTGID